jgi:hypothetical protein
MRVQNYCKICQRYESNRRMKIYYKKNIEQRKAYAKQYRENPANQLKIEKWTKAGKIRRRKEIKDNYAVELLKQRTKLTAKDIRKYPELIETYRLQLKLKRKLREQNKSKI